MDASNREIELSRVACLLDELAGKRIYRDHWEGYHPKVYNNARLDGDALVAKLCKRLQSLDVTQYSLEMQTWWRDHQAADKARVKANLEELKDEAARLAALAKLTPHERKLLGL